MKIGPYEIHVVENGLFGLDGGAMFGIIPKVLWERRIPSDPKNRIPLSTRSLLLISKNEKIIVETGIGTSFSKKEGDIYAIDHSKYSTEKSLSNLGFKREEITHVFLTHLHFDHVGGATYKDKDNIPQLTFPNAKYLVQKKQWEWALNPTDKDKVSFEPSLFTPLQEYNVLELLDGEGKWLDSLEIFIVNGHTEAQQMLYLADGEQSLLFCGDLIPTSAHIGYPWIMGYDNQPLVTLKEKKYWIPRIFEEKGILFFGHDPKVAYGTLEKEPNGKFKLNTIRSSEVV
ncbi:MAG: hypothetical protein A3F16_01030 [Deltaproteobacteria bacterium RIFCSPHIGHO2_12_FULL_43_9]|nr:MAG: hypothetical protein A3F16_01030 [Deltaproteobacteria bacterium RIFCSPHIGHO2_12_FULL_43_9]